MPHHKTKILLVFKTSWCYRTRHFSNHESCLLLRSLTFAIIVIDSIPVKVICAMCKSIQISLISKSHEIHYWPFFKNLSQKVNNPKWPLDDLCWYLACDSTQWSLCPTPMEMQSMWIQWPFFKKLTQRSMTPDDLWLYFCQGHMCNSTQGAL